MARWRYSLTSNTIWVNFDFGTVVADSREEATKKATAIIERDLKTANSVLAHVGIEINMNFNDLTLERY